MFEFAFRSSLIGAALLFSATSLAQTVVPSIKPPVGKIAMEPVLLHSLSGGSLSGTTEEQLVVYNSGLMVISKSNVFFGTVDVDARSAQLSEAALMVLRRRLDAAGAFGLGDTGISVTDVPLHTLTVFKGATNAHAHSFSYWLGSDDYFATDQLIQELIYTHFPGF